MPRIPVWSPSRRSTSSRGPSSIVGGLAAVPQTVVAATWRSAPSPEISAVELARQAGAGVAVYARVDSLPGKPDSVRVSLLAIDATTTKVLFGVLLRWPAADPDGLARSLAEHVRHNHPVKAAT